MNHKSKYDDLLNEALEDWEMYSPSEAALCMLEYDQLDKDTHSKIHIRYRVFLARYAKAQKWDPDETKDIPGQGLTAVYYGWRWKRKPKVNSPGWKKVTKYVWKRGHQSIVKDTDKDIYVVPIGSSSRSYATLEDAKAFWDGIVSIQIRVKHQNIGDLMTDLGALANKYGVEL